jgi:hypothetical protein
MFGNVAYYDKKNVKIHITHPSSGEVIHIQNTQAISTEIALH